MEGRGWVYGSVALHQRARQRVAGARGQRDQVLGNLAFSA